MKKVFHNLWQVVLVSFLLGATVMAQESINWGTQADNLRGRNGQQFTFACPGNGTISGRIWGTDIYTDDSSICTAAVHAGLFTTQWGGTVVIEIRPGAAAYAASTRNGVTSRDYGSWAGSYVIVSGKSNPVTNTVHNVPDTNWGTQAIGWRGQNGQYYTLQCPPRGAIAGNLWGTDLYTDDSSICTAAVHAGLITVAAGGVVTIEIRPGAAAYAASTRNGVTSRSYGGWAGSFIFSKPNIFPNTDVKLSGNNLAKNRPARQSSTSEWSNPNDAQGAVDGVKNGSYGFHTESETNPWWQVDLGENVDLAEIRIFNRLDCCSERARTIQILLSNDGVNWTTAYSNKGTVFGGTDGNPLSVSLQGYSARFIRLQLNETNYLHLDEVEIY
jgi:hypothetical protein